MNGRAKLVRVSWMAVALLPWLAGIAGAANPIPPQTNQPNQQDQQVATTMPEQTGQFQSKLEEAKDLIGAKVVNDKDERLGTVADIVLTPDRNAVNYVVLSRGGVLGMGDKLFAVPWAKFGLQPTEKEQVLVLTNVAKADLDRAPGFDKDRWPTAANENWLGIERNVHRNPDETPSSGAATAPESREYTEPMAEEPLSDRDEPAQAVAPERGTSADAWYYEEVGGLDEARSDEAKSADIERLRLSKILGMTVRNLQNEELGKLKDAEIDVYQGKLAYGIIAIRSGFLGLNKDFAAIPWSTIDLKSQPGVARLDTDKQTLMAIAFNKDNFPNLEDPQYSRQLHERFHATPYWETLGFVPGDTEHPDSSAWKEGGSTSMHHPGAAKTIRGAVESVGTYRLEGTNREGLSLRVKTDDGKIVTVQVGPRSYLDRRNVMFHSGDPVTVIGMPAKAAAGDAIVASQIKMGDKTLDLRTKEGKPLWNLDEFRDSDETGDSGQMQESYDL